MSFLSILAILAASCILASSNDVVELTKQTSVDFVAANEHSFIIFYTTPLSRNDQKLLNEFKQLPKLLSQSGHPVNITFAQFDVSELPKFTKINFKLKKFPKILFYKKGERFVYDAGVGSAAMLNWLKRQTKPQPIYSQYLKDQEAINEFFEKNPHSTVFFGSNDSKDYTSYIEVAKKLLSSKFAHVIDEELKAVYNITGRCGILVSNKAENDESQKLVVFEPKDDKVLAAKDITEFITDNTGATLIPFEHHYYHRLARNLETFMILFVDNSTSAVAIEAQNKIRNISKKVKKTMLVLVLEIDGKDESRRIFDEEGLKESDLPALYIIQKEKNARYKLVGDLNSKNVWNFLQKWKKGELKQVYKGVQAPEQNDGPLYEIVYENFENMIVKSDKDVLLEFYSPGCHNCKKVTPHLMRAAAALKNNPNIMIARVDAVQNEIPGVTIKNFPTFKFYKKGNKDKPSHVYGATSYGGILESLKNLVSDPWVEPLSVAPFPEEL